MLPYVTPISRPRAHEITPMAVRIQEECLNIHAKHLADTAIQIVFEEVQHEEEQEPPG